MLCAWHFECLHFLCSTHPTKKTTAVRRLPAPDPVICCINWDSITF